MNAHAPILMQGVQGALTGLSGDILHGWALDFNYPDLQLAIEVYVDQQFVALVRADMEQSNNAEGGGFHGFAVQLKSHWLEKARYISARVANQGPWLSNRLTLPNFKSSILPISTQVWYSGGLTIGGWAWDSEQPARYVTVRVSEKGKPICESEANNWHPALIYRESADHGFRIELPWELADGKPHEIHIETDFGEQLTGSPLQVLLHPEGLTNLLDKAFFDVSLNASDLEAKNLLLRLSRQHDLLLPRSAGFSCYSQWYSLYQKAPDINIEYNKESVLVVIITEGNGSSDRFSETSIDKQRLPADKVFKIKSTSKQFVESIIPYLNKVKFVIPLFSGDRLANYALDEFFNVFDSDTSISFVYSDCDQDDFNQNRTNPWLKPAWDETLFFGTDLLSSGIALSTVFAKKAIDFIINNPESSNNDWHWFLAGIIAVTDVKINKIKHLPKILYHRGYLNPSSPELMPANAERQLALQWLAGLRAPGAIYSCLSNFPGLGRVNWPLPHELPMVSLIIPTRDQVKLLRSCIEGLLNNTEYPSLEIIVVDNDSTDKDALAYFYSIMQRGVKVLSYPYPFNYSKINNFAVKYCSGSIIGLVNNDIEVLDKNWLCEMLSQLLRPNVGIVGAKLLWPNKMVQHGGVVVGVNGLAAHTGNYNNQDDFGYLAFNQIAREQSAVTAACLLVRRSDYEKLNGLEESLFPVTFNDVDFCLRLRKMGLKIVWTPFAQLIHAESASRGKEDSAEKLARARREQNNFIARWADYINDDIYYNPSLSSDYMTGPYGGLAVPPRNSNVDR